MRSINPKIEYSVVENRQPLSVIDSEQGVQAKGSDPGALNDNPRYSILTFSWGAPADSMPRFPPHFAVEFASSGRDALVRLNARAFNVYILDYFVPDWGGAPLCAEIRKQDAHVPIIFYSTYRDPKALQRMLHAGANIHLVAPDHADLLLTTVDCMLEAAESRDKIAGQSARLAIVTEFDRLSALAQQMAHQASSLSPQSILRTTRGAACKAFLAAGGTCAGFERWWTSARLELTRAPSF